MKLEKADCLSFTATVGVSLGVYLLTLPPEAGLGNDGYFSVAAMRLGVPMPAGFPLWLLWTALFVRGLPFGNIAIRAALASAVAAAMTCGVIALIVSQLGRSIMRHVRVNHTLDQNEEKLLRAVCGYVAGLTFGLSRAFWPWAVKVDPISFNMLLLCIVIGLLLWWARHPGSTRILYAAALIYGGLLSDNQIELALAPAIPFFVAIHNRELGRDMYLVASLLFAAGLAVRFTGHFSTLDDKGAFPIYLILGSTISLAGVFLTILTRRIFSQWRAVLICCAAAVCGLTPYLWLPLFSMTNPPANWGYPRTVEGFTSLVCRYQYNRLEMTDSPVLFLDQVGQYFGKISDNFGWLFLIVALAPLLFVRRLGPIERRHMAGLLVIFAFLAFLVLAVLNPTRDNVSQGMYAPFLPMSGVILAILMGGGLVLLGAFASCTWKRSSILCQP